MPVLCGFSNGSIKDPKKKSQPSRKGKKTWRKNVDVTEIEKGLQNLHEEIIRGGVISEKASSELFTIDLKGNPAPTVKLHRRDAKVLKVDEILSQRSVIPAVSSCKRPGEKPTSELVSAKRQRTDWVSHKELARLRSVADGRHDGILAVVDTGFDIWDADAGSKRQEQTDFLPKPQTAKMPKSMKQKPISLTASGKHVPAVQNPSGGFSYNPAFADYEKRLNEEGAKALEAEKKRLAAKEADRAKQEAAARSAAEAEATEVRVDMSEWEEDSEWEGFQSGIEDENLNTTRSKRKKKAQRNRVKRRKEEERLAKCKVTMKERRIQERRILDIVREVEEKDRQRAAVTEEPSLWDQGDDENLRRRQLGKFKLPEKGLELVLPDELQESLRLLKPEGNLLKDRYRSMLVRGKVESRRHLPFKRQAKRKLTEKWAYKDFVL